MREEMKIQRQERIIDRNKPGNERTTGWETNAKMEENERKRKEHGVNARKRRDHAKMKRTKGTVNSCTVNVCKCSVPSCLMLIIS